MDTPGEQPQGHRKRESAPPSIAEAVQAPLARMFEEYSEAIETMRKAIAALEPFAQAPAAASRSAPAATAAALETITVDVSEADRQALMDFEEALGQIAGVQRVALKDLSEGHASFEVTLAARAEARAETGPGLSVICAWCGKLLTLGGARISQGLCSECAAEASSGGGIRELAEQWEAKPRDDALVYLKRAKQAWVERRPDGKGGWHETRTTYPPETAAHVVLERVSAKYPDHLVVVAGDDGTFAKGALTAAAG
jgi:hypothetical protein